MFIVSFFAYSILLLSFFYTCQRIKEKKKITRIANKVQIFLFKKLHIKCKFYIIVIMNMNIALCGHFIKCLIWWFCTEDYFIELLFEAEFLLKALKQHMIGLRLWKGALFALQLNKDSLKNNSSLQRPNDFVNVYVVTPTVFFLWKEFPFS